MKKTHSLECADAVALYQRDIDDNGWVISHAAPLHPFGRLELYEDIADCEAGYLRVFAMIAPGHTCQLLTDALKLPDADVAEQLRKHGYAVRPVRMHDVESGLPFDAQENPDA